MWSIPPLTFSQLRAFGRHDAIVFALYGDVWKLEMLIDHRLARMEQNRKERPASDPNAPPKPKRKRPKKNDEAQKQTAANSIESDLRAQSLRSLLELIRPDDAPGIISEDPQSSAQPQIPQPAPPQEPVKRARQVCDACKVKKTKVGMVVPLYVMFTNRLS
jgi:hypothetical protein